MNNLKRFIVQHQLTVMGCLIGLALSLFLNTVFNAIKVTAYLHYLGGIHTGPTRMHVMMPYALALLLEAAFVGYVCFELQRRGLLAIFLFHWKVLLFTTRRPVLLILSMVGLTTVVWQLQHPEYTILASIFQAVVNTQVAAIQSQKPLPPNAPIYDKAKEISKSLGEKINNS